MSGVGMPAELKLRDYGLKLYHAFDTMPYQVGSSIHSKIWRDVDVRIMLPDDLYEQMGFGEPSQYFKSKKWQSMCLAYSALGKEMTGLPIDFQIQQLSYANSQFTGARSAMVVTSLIP